jgi:dTDP-4-amino-4,6-dideoxygalactose transaminase
VKADTDLTIPLVDLAYQHRLIEDDLSTEWQEIIGSNAFIGGSVVARFEDAFARSCDIPHCVGVANGTDAIEMCLRAAGVVAGDEVILPTNSYVATAFAVIRMGATPVMVDVDERTLLVDPDDVGRAVTERTRAVIPVHLFGQLAPTEMVQQVVGPHIALIEDAAQAQGATRFGRTAGNFGEAAAMSFYPSKNLGAYGDAGCVLTRSGEFARRIRELRNHGGESKNVHTSVGFNSRLDPLQAAVLLCKLRYLLEWNQQRQAAAAIYDELLEPHPEVRRVPALKGNEHVWYVYVVRVHDRDRVLGKLNQAGIGAAVHYPIPIHLLEPFRELGYEEGDLPNAEAAAQEVLSLPMSPGLTPEQQQRVVTELTRALV